MAGNTDFINILRELRGSGKPGEEYTDGIWYELTIADIDGNPGIYGDILAKYGVVTESAGTFDQAVAILENLNVEVTTLDAGEDATSTLVDGVWQIGIPRGLDGVSGEDGSTPDVSIDYADGEISYTVTVDGVDVTNTLLDLENVVDTVVNANVDVQTTLQAKEDVDTAVGVAQGIVDSISTTVASKKTELDSYTDDKVSEIDTASNIAESDFKDLYDATKASYDANAVHRVEQYDENHDIKLAEYNANDGVKLDEYNYNHQTSLENINIAYADRIVQMIKTRNFMGIMDEFVAATETHMITFLSTDDDNYIYYGNGVLLEEDVDYTIYDETTIELTVKANPYDVITQVNTQILNDMLTAEGVLFADRIGAANGVAGLDENALVPASQLPSYVDDVLEFATYADLPVEGETGKIYLVVADETSGDNTSSYRWTGTVYAMVSNTLNAEDIKALYESNPDTNAFTDDQKLKLADTEVTAQLDARDVANRNTDNHVDGTANGVYTLVERTKLATVEENAKDDQTAEEIEALYEGLANTNKYTDEEKDKLDSIEDEATADQTAEEIETLYEGLINTNKYTDDEKEFVDVGTTLDTTADTLPQAINEVHDELNDHIGSITAHAAGAITHTPGDNTYAISTDVQTTIELVDTELEEQDDRLTTNEGHISELKTLTGSTSLTRYDKALASMNTLNMSYTSGDLVTVRYAGDNDVDMFYRDVLTYDVDGDLANVKHYYGTIDLTTESGLTTLTYDVDKNLETATYTEV